MIYHDDDEPMRMGGLWPTLAVLLACAVLIVVAVLMTGCSKAATISPAEYKHEATRKAPLPASATRVEVAPVTTTTTTTITIPESKP